MDAPRDAAHSNIRESNFESGPWAQILIARDCTCASAETGLGTENLADTSAELTNFAAYRQHRPDLAKFADTGSNSPENCPS